MGDIALPSGLKYALVHEWLTPLATGGSELVVQEILQQIDADLYALIDFESTNPHSYLHGRRIGTTFLQHLPFARQGVQKYLPLLPLAIEQLDLRAYDIVLSSSHAVSKGVITSPQQVHICYCHAPMRYAWDLTFDYLNSSRAGQGIPGIFTRYLLHRLRQWDALAANRVDYFIANSKTTARRIQHFYRREAEVIYPPVQVDRLQFQPEKEAFYLTVARLVSYKKVPLIVEAFNQLGKPLVVIGGGSELKQIQHIAGPTIQVLGWQPDEVVRDYMARAKAFVYAAHEDFGIAPVEAQACGTPVIAYAIGGTGETVLNVAQFGEKGTGVLFRQQSVAAIVDAVQRFEAVRCQIQPEVVRSHALHFSPAVFQQRYQTFVSHCYQEFEQNRLL